MAAQAPLIRNLKGNLPSHRSAESLHAAFFESHRNQCWNRVEAKPSTHHAPITQAATSHILSLLLYSTNKKVIMPQSSSNVKKLLAFPLQ